MNRNGWIKVHRKILDNPIVCKDGDYLAVWIYLLLEATHQSQEKLFKRQKITLKPGQLITGRKAISSVLKVSESKIQRVLSSFEEYGQIEQQMSNQNRLITIVQWDSYQGNEQQMNNERTTDEQQVNTLQECKNDKNDKKCVYSTQVQPNTHTFGILENVVLTDAEHEQITNMYENPNVLIDKLSLWLPDHAVVKNHYAKLLTFAKNDNWVKRKVVVKENEIPVKKERAPESILQLCAKIGKKV